MRETVHGQKSDCGGEIGVTGWEGKPGASGRSGLGQHGVNIMMFCKEYNAKTADKVGMIIPAEITIYEDRSFTFVLKTPPASVLLAKAAGIEKGSGDPKGKRWGKLLGRNCGNCPDQTAGPEHG